VSQHEELVIPTTERSLLSLLDVTDRRLSCYSPVTLRCLWSPTTPVSVQSVLAFTAMIRKSPSIVHCSFVGVELHLLAKQGSKAQGSGQCRCKSRLKVWSTSPAAGCLFSFQCGVTFLIHSPKLNAVNCWCLVIGIYSGSIDTTWS
jgi:hypothetical protein